MKILQYFLLLLLLSAISLVVFILTQNPDFKVEKQFKVDVPKSTVYNYVKDLNNWSHWINTQKQDNGTYLLSIDKLGKYYIQSEYSYPSDSISQDILNDKGISNIRWKFSQDKDSLGTLVDFTFESSLDLKTKILTFFTGSPNQIARKEIEKNINSFAVYFIQHYKEHTFDSIGLLDKKATSYLSLPSKTVSIDKLRDQLIEDYDQLVDFTNSNNIQHQDVLVLFIDPSTTDKAITYKGSVAISQDIFLNPEDLFDLISLEDQSYFQTQLQGYYTHLIPSIKKSNDLLNQSDFNKDNNGVLLLEFDKASLESPLPSSWKTKIEIPILPYTLPSTTQDTSI